MDILLALIQNKALKMHEISTEIEIAATPYNLTK